MELHRVSNCTQLEKSPVQTIMLSSFLILSTPNFRGFRTGFRRRCNAQHRSISHNENYPFFKRIEPFFYNSRNTAPEKKDGLKVFPSNSNFAG